MEDRKIIIEKKIECIIGLILMMPTLVLVIIFFFPQISILDNMFFYLGGWESEGIIFAAILLCAGAYLIKDRLRYFIPTRRNDK